MAFNCTLCYLLQANTTTWAMMLPADCIVTSKATAVCPLAHALAKLTLLSWKCFVGTHGGTPCQQNPLASFDHCFGCLDRKSACKVPASTATATGTPAHRGISTSTGTFTNASTGRPALACLLMRLLAHLLLRQLTQLLTQLLAQLLAHLMAQLLAHSLAHLLLQLLAGLHEPTYWHTYRCTYWRSYWHSYWHAH